MQSLLVFVLLAATASGPYDQAEQLATSQHQDRVRDLYTLAAANDPDPLRREKAAVRAANLEWRVFKNAAAARKLLDGVTTADSWLQRSQMERELNHDYAAARDAAAKAMSAAKTREDRRRATIARAKIAIAERSDLKSAIADLQSVIAEAGPGTETSRLLLKAALLAKDDATALRALRWYYADFPSIVPATVPDLGLALANARLYPEAAIVSRDPDVLTYAAALERVTALADELYRADATGKGDLGAFNASLQREGERLWNALSWSGERPKFSIEALQRELDRRFGAYVSVGNTDNAPSMHYGHRIFDEKREVEQYGRKGTLRFILIDGVVSNGYMYWLREGTAGSGGWSKDDAVYQVRPMYANGPLRAWMRLTDPELRAKDDRDMASEAPMQRLEMRLQRQYAEALRASLKGLEGDALRDAFIERYRAEVFDTSIWAHEGRHAIDKIQFGIRNSTELEYRAKLSELAFAKSPRLPLAGSIVLPIGEGTAHGEANKRVLEGIARLTKLRDLTQLDTLTDEQLREAARKLDPMAR